MSRETLARIAYLAVLVAIALLIATGTAACHPTAGGARPTPSPQAAPQEPQ